MARVRSISSIESEIKTVEAELTKAQQKCDALSTKLLELQKLKHEYEAKQILEAFHKSGKSLQECKRQTMRSLLKIAAV